MKAERTMDHFIITTKGMILENGVKEVSVRKIADQAGFAPKSLYNHFGCLDTLLWHVRARIIEEISEYLNKYQPENIESTEDLGQLFENYIGYFIKKPEYYKFLFFHQLDSASKTVGNLTEDESFMASMSKAFDYMKSDYDLTDGQVIVCIQTLINVAQGLLTIHIAGNDSLNEHEVYGQFRSSIAFILRRD